MFLKFKQKFFKRRVFKNASAKNFYFIVSTGRTGTNFMEAFINKASHDVFCVHEPHPDLFNLSIEKYREKKSSNYIYEKLQESRYEVLHSFLNSRKSIYIESNPFAAFLVDNLKETFKNAKFIFIYRDIDTYLLSALNKSPLGNNVNNFYAKDDGRKRLSPIDFDNNELAKVWSDLSRAQKITWYWTKCNTYLRNYAKDNSGHVLELKFEDLFSLENKKKHTSFSKLFSYLNIELESKHLNELLKNSFDKRNSTEEKFYKSLTELSQHETEWIQSQSANLSRELHDKVSLNDLG
ncbi:hypothetical protein BST97_15545 [Nonlabens spongiae]|uniref:Sulfotransferase domain-containing protein n=1 Tax=Nonlabens spongiae TaxID=331648 RepID=A0A1W6MFY5_9FLAO|nr:sulfotransferase [Nonlabens spongiae]ARN76513.1 hypothetical protein BST97_00005 [Nonlabens spongiae]ARN79284.1 hypothetical protein BST97_15545 [Nonlabens spongiae]